jgi:glycosyltransferase involved in cell wall biosynthesis
MAKCYGDHDVALIPNAVDSDLFHATPRERQPAPTVGLMYATEAFKGLDVALAAIAEVRRTHPDLRVVAFGTKPVTTAFPLPSGAHYVRDPDQDQLRMIYASCDVFVTASRSEGFGLPIIEAMACRTPVVATRTGCAGDVIDDGIEGYVVNVDDASGLADGLRRILDLPTPDWRRMSDAAHARALSYSWDDATVLFEQSLIDI